jgi:2-dehydro-3-deoxyglucarate aldolase/4-hydroxy-2-oxoheptanedioate aldolase
VSKLKKRLMNREALIGSLVTMAHPDVAEALSLVGFDYLWIETEHSPMNIAQAQMMIQAVGGRCPCLVRIPANQEVWVKKALDTGCDGIIVPQIRTAEEVKDIVNWSRYPPLGRRSVGISRAHDYGMSFQEYVKRSNEELVVVIQIENTGAVENIAAIAAVPGVDAFFIGPFDLSGSLGVLGEITHPQVQEAIAATKGHCEAAGVPVGIFAVDASAARDAIADGFSLIGLSMDAVFLWQSAKAALDQARGTSH